MTITERALPNDLFSVEENGEKISITTKLGWIYVTLSKDGKIRKADQFSFIGFQNALQRLCCDVPPSPPSPDPGGPSTTTGERETGTQEDSVWDRKGPDLTPKAQEAMNWMRGLNQESRWTMLQIINGEFCSGCGTKNPCNCNRDE